MIVIKWEKDNYEEILYDLYVYTENNKKIHIAMLYWDDNHWTLVQEIPRLKPKTRWYENYTINELNDVLFRAVLDIQANLNEIFYICHDYNEAISDYIIDYIQGIDHNEN